MSKLTKTIPVAAIAALALAAASPAGAAGVGQTQPSETNCTSGYDRLQLSVTSGTSYVMPFAGRITSWSTDASLKPADQAGQLTMKVFRPTSAKKKFKVIGRDGPHALTGGTVNTFTTNIPVRAGDVLGSSTPTNAGSPACNFVLTGDTFLFRAGDLLVGQSGVFTDVKADRRLNISAVLQP